LGKGIPEPFSKIAEFYDELMEHVAYREWVNYSVSFLSFFNIRRDFFLDLACGTGTPTIYLSEFAEKVVGLDKSVHMLKVAKKKREEYGIKKVEFVAGDLRNFHFRKKFDAIFCFFDSMNYILDAEELLMVFQCAYETLKDNGAFIFDMNTIFALRDIWDTKTEVKVHKNFTSIWKNVWNEREKISELEITIEWEEEGEKKSVKEFHREKGYMIEEILDILRKAGFKRVFAYEHLKYTPPTPYTTRVQYVSIK